MTDHIGVPQLGRMCRVSSSWRAAALDDEAWAHLCCTRWPNTARLPRSMLTANGHLWWYKQRLKTLSLPPAPLAPPTLAAETLILLVDITLDGVTKHSVALTGAELQPLLDDGDLALPLPSPICLGDGKLSADGQFEFEDDGFDPSDLDWGVSVHLLRTTDHKCVCLFSLEGAYYDDDERIYDYPPEGPLEQVEIPKPPPCGFLDMHTNERALDLNAQGNAMAQLIDDFHGFYFELQTDVARPRGAQYFGYRDMVREYREHFENHVTMRNSSAAQFKNFEDTFWAGRGDNYNLDDAADDGSGDENDGLKQHFLAALAQPAEAKQMRITHFTLIAWQNHEGGASPFGADRVTEMRNGVTLLHLLQELRAWDD